MATLWVSQCLSRHILAMLHYEQGLLPAIFLCPLLSPSLVVSTKAEPPCWCCRLQTQKVRLDKLTQWPSPSDLVSSSTPDKATAYLLVLSLFVWSPTQWTASRQSLLLHLLQFTFSQQQPSSASSSSSSSTGASNVSSWREQSDEEIWRCAFPVIRYFGLVQCLGQRLKGDRDADWHAHAKSR